MRCLSCEVTVMLPLTAEWFREHQHNDRHGNHGQWHRVSSQAFWYYCNACTHLAHCRCSRAVPHEGTPWVPFMSTLSDNIAGALTKLSPCPLTPSTLAWGIMPQSVRGKDSKGLVSMLPQRLEPVTCDLLNHSLTLHHTCDRMTKRQ